jgi:hypothetical protein
MLTRIQLGCRGLSRDFPGFFPSGAKIGELLDTKVTAGRNGNYIGHFLPFWLADATYLCN